MSAALLFLIGCAIVIVLGIWLAFVLACRPGRVLKDARRRCGRSWASSYVLALLVVALLPRKAEKGPTPASDASPDVEDKPLTLAEAIAVEQAVPRRSPQAPAIQ